MYLRLVKTDKGISLEPENVSCKYEKAYLVNT